MEKVLILGNKGMLGHVLYEILQSKTYTKKYEVIGVNRLKINTDQNSFNIDVQNFDKLEKLIEIQQPKYVVNCIGILVQDSIAYPSLAIKINSLLPHVLNELSFRYNFKLTHISTDCVFDGKKGNYKEYDKKTETNYYGLTKNLGEIDNNKNLTIRTSIIGPELKTTPTGLFNWVLSKKRKFIDGYSNVIWSGLTTIELSKFIIWSFNKDLVGIIHATNSESISKYDLIDIINSTFNLDIKLNKELNKSVNKTLINNIVEDYTFPTYTLMIEEMKNWIDSSKEY